MKHIAVVDDESALRENLSYALEKEGYRVSSYANGLEAWKAYYTDPPDLYVLDIIMPRMDGLEFCRRLREKDYKTPIVFLSSKDGELDKITGLESGGDDYIGKPFSVKELIARVKAVLRRAGEEKPAEPVIKKGKLLINPENYKASWDGNEFVLTLSEYRLLSELACSPGVVKTRAELYSAAYPGDRYINERAVDSHIKRLRKKLEKAGAGKNILATVYGLGYMLELDS